MIAIVFDGYLTVSHPDSAAKVDLGDAVFDPFEQAATAGIGARHPSETARIAQPENTRRIFSR